MRIALAVLIVATAVGDIRASGQSPPGGTAAGTGLIAGRVVDAETGRPVPGAVTMLGCIGNNPPARDRVRVGADGQFAFLDLPPGAHSICVNKSGYALGATTRLELAAGQRRGDVVLQLRRVSQTVVSGRVIDDAGEPVVGVRVMLLTKTGGRYWQRGSARTDDRGEYRIANIAAGEYVAMIPSIQSTMPATTEAELASLKQSGRSMVELQRELNAAGIITGVQAPPARGTAGVLDSGSGHQVLETAALPPVSSGDGRLLVYPTTFSGNTTQPSSASTFRVTAGEERRAVDFRLRAVRTSRVSGRLSSSSGPGAHLAVKLIAAEPGLLRADLDVAATVSNASGAFEFGAVPHGQYLLKVLRIPRASALTSSPTTVETAGRTVTVFATQRLEIPPPLPDEATLWATLPITVGGAEVDGLAVTLRTGARLTGRVVFEGAAARPSAAELARLSIAITQADGRTIAGGMTIVGTAPAGRFSAGDTFLTPGLPDGQYFLNVATPPAGWFFKSAMLNGRDVSMASVELTGDDVTGIVMTFTDRATTVGGVVRELGDLATTDVRIIVFPTNQDLWKGGNLTRRIRAVTANDRGEFTVPAIVPGEYYAVAVPAERVPPDWQEAAFLQPLIRHARRASVADGATGSVDLVLTRIR